MYFDTINPGRGKNLTNCNRATIVLELFKSQRDDWYPKRKEEWHFTFNS